MEMYSLKTQGFCHPLAHTFSNKKILPYQPPPENGNKLVKEEIDLMVNTKFSNLQ